MEIYHGSLDIVKTPEIRVPNRTLDYGSGFYLTSSYEQAGAWVRRKLKGSVVKGYINVYEYHASLKTNLNVLCFETPNEAWLDFVMENRMNRNYIHGYDIVEGPVANDRVYASFALYEAGLINKQELINELRAYKLVNQILLHTEKALACVKWKEAREVTK